MGSKFNIHLNKSNLAELFLNERKKNYSTVEYVDESLDFRLLDVYSKRWKVFS
jgi:hypothetical protein